jgi:hypothetical protein
MTITHYSQPDWQEPDEFEPDADEDLGASLLPVCGNCAFLKLGRCQRRRHFVGGEYLGEPRQVSDIACADYEETDPPARLRERPLIFDPVVCYVQVRSARGPRIHRCELAALAPAPQLRQACHQLLEPYYSSTTLFCLAVLDTIYTEPF